MSSDSDVSGNHGGYDVWVVKLNNTRSIAWQKCPGDTNDESGEDTVQLAEAKLNDFSS